MDVLLFNPDDELCVPVKKWIKNIELFCKQYGFSEDQIFCFARGKLGGRAKYWVDETSKVNNWCDFRREIQRTFCNAQRVTKDQVATREKKLQKNDYNNLKQLFQLMKVSDEVVKISKNLCYDELELLADDLERSILGEVISGDQFPRDIINIETTIRSDLERFFKNILVEHRSAVSTDFFDIGTSKTHELVINTKSTQSNKISKLVKDFPQQLLRQLLSTGSIQKSTRKACNNWILNKDQPILDLRELNSAATQEPADLIILDPLLNSLPYFRYFTTLTFDGGHLQIPVQKASRKHLTFATNLGTYELCRAPKHFVNTSIIFSKILIEVVRKLRPGDAVAVFDELIIPSMTVEEGLQKISVVLGALKAFGLTVDLRESRFFSEELRLFEWRISYGRRIYEGLDWPFSEPAWRYLKSKNLCVSHSEAMINIQYLDFGKEFELHFMVEGNELISILLQMRNQQQSNILGFCSKTIRNESNKSLNHSVVFESILNFKRFLVYKPFKIVTEIDWLKIIIQRFNRNQMYLEQQIRVQQLRFSVKEPQKSSN